MIFDSTSICDLEFSLELHHPKTPLLMNTKVNVEQAFIGKIARNHQHAVFTNYYTSRAQLEYEAAVQNYYDQASEPGDYQYARYLQ